MAGFFDLHRHDEFSFFDGFGKAEEMAKLAKELGYSTLGISNHGNTNGLVKHFNACKKYEIKPVLGVEGYFLPVIKEQTKGYHLCLFAKNAKGYENINTLQTIGDGQKYYNAIFTLENLKEFNDGVICTTACVGSYFSQSILKGKSEQCEKMLKEFKLIFGKDFYVEIMPYKIDKNGTQEQLNVKLIELANKIGVKCILTSDSHRGYEDDFDSYLKMHQMGKHDSLDVSGTYKDRYMPSEKDIMKRFWKMHKDYFGSNTAKKMAIKFAGNLEEISEKVDGDFLSCLPSGLPKFEGLSDGDKLIEQRTKEGLRKRGKWNKEYCSRAIEELKVIKHHGFADYFLMVADYVTWAKSRGIAVGPGRGSACNCLVSWCLYATEVDPIKFGLDYHRFIRIDKKKMPDIDVDFQTSRRQEVIEYLVDKYKGRSAQIASYGKYKVDNLINDLGKICGLETTGSGISDAEKSKNKQILKEIKLHAERFVNQQMEEISEEFYTDKTTLQYNKDFDNICKHFSKLYGKVRFIGTHAAGVAIVNGNILSYTSLREDKNGKTYICYDLEDAQNINIVKFDILGLKTMESVGELRNLTGLKDGPEFDEIIKDKEVIENFQKGNTVGVFQFESSSAQGILKSIQPTNFGDLCAASSLNRPGPLGLRMHEEYGNNKMSFDSGELDLDGPYTKFMKDTYGTVIYQEQIQSLVTEIGKLSWEDADRVIKMGTGGSEVAMSKKYKDYLLGFEKQFVENSVKLGVPKEKASKTYKDFFNYSFNKGHGTGYTLISIEEMFYKVHYPTFFWYVKLRDCSKDEQVHKFLGRAVQDGSVVFLPHVNYSADYSIRKVDEEWAIQQGMSSIKNVGEKAAAYIEAERKKNGVFCSYDNFYDRCKSRTVTSRVIDTLKEQGALCFEKRTYIARVTKFNSVLYMKNV